MTYYSIILYIGIIIILNNIFTSINCNCSDITYDNLLMSCTHGCCITNIILMWQICFTWHLFGNGNINNNFIIPTIILNSNNKYSNIYDNDYDCIKTVLQSYFLVLEWKDSIAVFRNHSKNSIFEIYFYTNPFIEFIFIFNTYLLAFGVSSCLYSKNTLLVAFGWIFKILLPILNMGLFLIIINGLFNDISYDKKL